MGKFICDICNKSFARNNNLTLHKQKIHGEYVIKYACPFCDKKKQMVVPYKGNLVIHIRRVHKTEKIDENLNFQEVLLPKHGNYNSK